jgi:hypothetical protein
MESGGTCFKHTGVVVVQTLLHCHTHSTLQALDMYYTLLLVFEHFYKKNLILKFNEFMIYGGETSSLWYCSIDTL